MLTKVVVDNLQGSTLELPLSDISGGYVIKDIAGIDPVKATISSSQFAQLDGSSPQGSRRENRNIMLKVGIEPDYSLTDVRTLRSALYAFFMPKTFVKLAFYMDDVHFVDITGQVESCEAPPFSKDPEANISIICFDPDFIAPASVVVAGNTTSGSTETELVNAGTVDSGYIFKLAVNRSVSAFTIYNRRPSGDMFSMDVALSMVNLDEVKVSTQAKNKYATLRRSSVDSSILYAVATSAKWAPLSPGSNFIRILASGAAIPYTIEYVPRYGGL